MIALPILEEIDDRITEWEQEERGLGALRTERGLLPLEAVNLSATIDGLTAYLRLTQTFVNVHNQPLEATYIFPLPERAAVQRFRLFTENRIIEGDLKERGTARREYREAIAQGHQAAITEEERPGTFTLRVGNIPPGERATVDLELAQPLPCFDGEATFRFPLVVAPRYIPGIALGRAPSGTGTHVDTCSVPDASRISPPVLLPGFPNPVMLSVDVNFPESDLMPSNVRSSLHTVIEEQSQKGLALRLLTGERLNRDFILRFQLSNQSIRPGLSIHPDADGKGGTFALTVFPPALNPDRLMRPRDIIFVLDRSGSMGGWKMVTARRAVARLIECLNPRDQFSVYAFDDNIETPTNFRGDQLVPATFGHRGAALDFLSSVNSRGGTEMEAPLDLAVSRLLSNGADNTRDKIMVLITDGQVGNEPQIIKRLGNRLKHVRVHALGIDRAVNAGFLQQLANLGGGSNFLVESESLLEDVIDKVQRNIATPVLTKLALETKGLKIDQGSITPARLPDLVTGSHVMIMGRYHGTAQGSLELAGYSSDETYWTIEMPAEARKQPALPALWAKQRLRDLEDRYTIRSSTTLEKEIVDLSLKFRVLCKFTSFLAVDRSQIVNTTGKQRQITQPVESPQDWADVQELPRHCAIAPPGYVGYSAPTYEDMEDSDQASDIMGLSGFTASYGMSPARRATPSFFAPSASRPPAPQPPPAPAKSESFFGRMRKRLIPSSPAPGSQPALDRTQFQPKITAVLEILQKATTFAKQRAVMKDVIKRLNELIKAATKAGDTSGELQRLKTAVETLSKAIANPRLGDVEMSSAWNEAIAALQAFSTTTEPEDFWK